VYCPYCRHTDSRVIDSRTADDGAAIRRRRSCPACGRRFTTQETVILTVGKRSGVTEPFNRDKIVNGVRRACQGRPVTEDQLAILAQQVEDAIRTRGSGEIPSHEVGLAILGPLRELDEVAYLRFASVYRGFESLADFEDEIATLRSGHLREPGGSAAGLARPADRTPAVSRARGWGHAQRAAHARPLAGRTAGKHRQTSGEDLYRSAMGSTRIPEGGEDDRDDERVGGARWQGLQEGAHHAPHLHPCRRSPL
jgi:transcriptional repressor NrdR